MARRPRGVRRRTLLQVSIAAGLGGIALANPVAAQPEEVSACTVIDEPGEYILTEDLSQAEGCLEITASDVTLDGDGHTIAGDGTGYALTISANNVTVRNLSIVGFDRGIEVFNANDVTLANLDVTGHVTGIHASMGEGLTLDDVTIANNDADGIFYSIWNGLEVSDATIRNNGGAAINSDEGWGLTLNDAVLEENGAGVRASPGDAILDSTIVGNDEYGISVDPFPQPPFDDPATIAGNDLAENGRVGLEVLLGHADVYDNDITGNDTGVLVDRAHDDPDDAWDATAAINDNRIEGNDAGLVYTGEDTIDATCNWWGDESGPAYEDSPNDDPQGDSVEGAVDVVPWRAAPDEEECTGGQGEENGDESAPEEDEDGESSDENEEDGEPTGEDETADNSDSNEEEGESTEEGDTAGDEAGEDVDDSDAEDGGDEESSVGGAEEEGDTNPEDSSTDGDDDAATPSDDDANDGGDPDENTTGTGEDAGSDGTETGNETTDDGTEDGGDGSNDGNTSDTGTSEGGADASGDDTGDSADGDGDSLIENGNGDDGTGIPGFGFLGGIAGLGGAAFALDRFFGGEE